MSNRSFTLDPRIFISPPFYACPQCRREAFGTLMISGRRWTRRCRECWHTASEDLPPVRKTLVYLDQMVLSNMAKALDPVWRKKKGVQDPYWTELFDQLDRAFKLQLLICPMSPTHEKESSLIEEYWPVLRRLYEHLSSGVEFQLPLMVYHAQLHHALTAHLAGERPDYSSIPRSAVLRGKVDEWLERLQVRVNIGAGAEQIAQRREARKRSHEGMKILWDRWAEEKGASFDTWYARERHGMAEVLIARYAEHLQHLAAVYAGQAPLSEDVINPFLEVDVVASLLRRFEEASVPKEELHQRLRDFLFSEDAMDAPYNDIGALLMAALARRASSGQKRVPSPGTFTDLTTIAAYLPYCDAIFVDDEFAGLLGEKPLRPKVNYGAHVFSNKTREAFLEYLVALELRAPDGHVELVARVYGENWAVPFREILEHERAR